MSLHVLVRADGNGQIGLGHIMRTMSVADELRRTGTQITYICRQVPSWIEGLLRQRGHDLWTLEPTETLSETGDAEDTVRALTEVGADTILLDHYGLARAWTTFVKSKTGCFIAAFDDLAEVARDVDVLIDASPGRSARDYEHLVPPAAVRLVGPDYAPLRPEFALAAETSHTKREGRCHVAISMGGVDPANVTLECLDALDRRSDVEITVILSSAALHLEAVKKRIERMHVPTRLLLDRSDMADILQGVDIVLGAGGTSAMERCALGLPSVLAVLAENQTYNAANLARAGAAVVLPKNSTTAILESVEPLLENASLRAEMGRAADALCDGLGAPRVAASILSKGRDVTLGMATMGDMSLVYDWQREPGARRFARNPDVPEREEHEHWFASRLQKLDKAPFYIVRHAGTACGFVRLDLDKVRSAWEVSVLISRKLQGRGVAWAALGLLRLAHPKREIVATVHPENEASQRLFKRAGYRQIAPDQFVSEGWPEIVERQQNED